VNTSRVSLFIPTIFLLAACIPTSPAETTVPAPTVQGAATPAITPTSTIRLAHDELYLRHAIYDGRLIHTEILTGALYDDAQPRWATPPQRTAILKRIFKAAPSR